MSDISIYGFVTSLSSLTTFAICRDLFSPVTFRLLVMITVVISMFCFILLLKLTLASSGMASFSPFVCSRLDGKFVRAFTINSDSRFRAPSGHLESRFGNTLMISTLDSFLFLHCGLAEAHLLTERAQAAAYIMCYLLIISEAGYFIGIEKSQLVPSKWTRVF